MKRTHITPTVDPIAARKARRTAIHDFLCGIATAFVGYWVLYGIFWSLGTH